MLPGPDTGAGQPPTSASMLLLVLFAIGFAPGLVIGLLLQTPRRRLILAGAAIVTWMAYTVYIGTIASCPARSECAKWLGVVFLGAVLAGWLGGVAASWVVRRPVRS